MLQNSSYFAMRRNSVLDKKCLQENLQTMKHLASLPLLSLQRPQEKDLISVRELVLILIHPDPLSSTLAMDCLTQTENMVE